MRGGAGPASAGGAAPGRCSAGSVSRSGNGTASCVARAGGGSVVGATDGEGGTRVESVGAAAVGATASVIGTVSGKAVGTSVDAGPGAAARGACIAGGAALVIKGDCPATTGAGNGNAMATSGR